MTSSWRLPAWLAFLFAAGGGALSVLAFPHYSIWWLAPISLTLLALAVRGRRGRGGAWLGFVHGLAMLIPLLSWTGIQVGALPWLALSVLEAGFHAVGGLALALTIRLAASPGELSRWRRLAWAVARLGGTAAVWVGVEALQSRIPFGGFGWSSLAFSQADAPTLGLAALGGAPLVTFAVGLAGVSLAELIVVLTSGRQWTSSRLRARGPQPETSGTRQPHGALARWGRAGALLTVAVVVTLAGVAVPRPTAAQDGTIDVAGIQGSVPQMGMEFNAKRRAVLDKHAGLTQQLAADVKAGRYPQPDLVVWPENASDIDPYANPDAYQEISAAVDAAAAPTLVGTLVLNQNSGRIRNTVLVWQPGIGPTAAYAKRDPVPFAEYVPYRSFFRAITPLVDKAGDMEPGTAVGALPVATRRGSVTVGILICFEVVPDTLVRDVVDHGAQILIVPTNNATFGFTDESRQQLAISRLRAVETGRAVAHVSTVGVSALIAPDGTVVSGSPLFSPTILSGRLPLRSSVTVATHLGSLPEWTITGLAVLAAALGWRRRCVGSAAVAAVPAVHTADERADVTPTHATEGQFTP